MKNDISFKQVKTINATEFEINLVRMLADGCTVRQIALEVNRSNRAVEGNLYKLRKRLDCATAAHLVAVFFREKLVK